MTDIVTNLWSMGVHGPVETEIKAIVDTFAAGDGFFVLKPCGRSTTALAEVIGRPEWNDDPRFTGSAGWIDNAGECGPPSRRGPPRAPRSKQPRR